MAAFCTESFSLEVTFTKLVMDLIDPGGFGHTLL